MLYTKICNAIWMYLWVGALLLAVIVQCLIFMKKAWKHALELGLQPAQIKKGLTTGSSCVNFADAIAGRSASVVKIVDYWICILRNVCSNDSFGMCRRDAEAE